MAKLNIPMEELEKRRVSFDTAVEDSSPTSPDFEVDYNIEPKLTKPPKYLRRASATPSVKSENGSVSTSKPRKRLSSKFESLDYNAVESARFLQDQETLKPANIQRAAITRWFVNFLVGVYVAVIAVLVAVLITYISKVKFMAIYARLNECYSYRLYGNISPEDSEMELSNARSLISPLIPNEKMKNEINKSTSVLEDCDHVACLVPPTLVWIAVNVVLVSIGSYLVTYHAPHAAGSGIPQIKCYLNGIKLPGLLSLKTLVAKAGGVVLSVAGGLACGKEGPMIHSGAICASGMSHGEFHCCGKECKPDCCEPLRSDEERRDFVAAGAASGVSAAFASPVGGVLFSLEEGASFLNQMLTWRMLFSSMTASLMLNIFMSAIKGTPDDMSHPGLVSFGYLSDISFKTFEIPIFMLLAVIGGMLGALFVYLNYRIVLLRRRFLVTNWLKVAEAVTVAACSAIILMVVIYAVPDCQPIRGFHPPNETDVSNGTGGEFYNTTTGAIYHTTGGNIPSTKEIIQSNSTTILPLHHHLRRRDTGLHDNSHDKHASDLSHAGNDTKHHDDHHDDHHHNPYGDHGGGHGYVFQGFCPYGYHNRMADILFKTPEGGLHAVLHSPLDEWNFVPLIVLVIVYHLLATWTYGLMVSSGVFIPSLLIGALWGRICGMIVMMLIPAAGTNVAKYALVGAACQLGGTVRMTISLAVIVIECTGDITFGIPIILSLLIAKWMGDFFIPGIYDLQIEVMGIPLLPWQPPEMCHAVSAREVMNTPVVCMRSVERIGRIMKILENPEVSHNGFPVVEDYDPDNVDSAVSGNYGRLKGFILKSQLESILEGHGQKVADEELSSLIDLRLHMDRSPFSIQEHVSLPRIFKLFRGLGLRHLVVVNDRNRVVGIISRINLARYRAESSKGKFILEELEIHDQ